MRLGLVLRSATVAAAAVLALASPAFAQPSPDALVTVEEAVITDAARQRQIPVAFYQVRARDTRPRLAVISHGYGGSHKGYEFVARWLAANGYFVVSIQHEVPGDPPLPTDGVPAVVRRPSWERGVQNIRYVIHQMKRRRRDVDASRLLLVGHSHGGDTSVLFAEQYPGEVEALITLDHRRLALPRVARPRVLTLRSSDVEADPGVLPSPEEQASLGMTVVRLPATAHDAMSDVATPAQKAEMLGHIERFVRALP